MTPAEETLALNKLAQVADDHLVPSAKEADRTMQPVVDNAPAPVNEVTNSASAASPRTAVSQQTNTSPLSVPHEASDIAQQYVPPPTGDERLGAAALAIPQQVPSEGSPPAGDKETVNVPQQSEPPPTIPDMTTAKNPRDTECSNLPLQLGDRAPTKTCRQPQDGLDATSEADKQLGAVNATQQVKNSRTLPRLRT